MITVKSKWKFKHTIPGLQGTYLNGAVATVLEINQGMICFETDKSPGNRQYVHNSDWSENFEPFHVPTPIISIVQDAYEFCVSWSGVDRNVSWSARTRATPTNWKLLNRLSQAVDAGKAYIFDHVATDVHGKTYVIEKSGTTPHWRQLNAWMKRNGL